MSYAMDDISSSGSVKLIEVGLEQNHNIDSKQAESVEMNQEFEELTISDDFENKVSDIEKINLQEKENLVETADQGLSSVDAMIDNLKTQTEKVMNDSPDEEELAKINDSINESLKKIEETAQKTSFNGMNPIDGSLEGKKPLEIESKEHDVDSIFKNASPEALGLPAEVKIENKEEAAKLNEQIDSAKEEIENRQETIEFAKYKLIEPVSSTITLGAPEEADPFNFSESSAEISHPAIKDIEESPAKSVKMQVKSLDKNMILALMSLGSA